MYACDGGCEREKQMKGSTSHNEHCLVQCACACHSSMAWHAMPFRTNWYGTHIVECNAITVFKWSSRVHTLHFGRCVLHSQVDLYLLLIPHALTLCALPCSSSVSIHLRIKLTPFHIHFHSTFSHHRLQTQFAIHLYSDSIPKHTHTRTHAVYIIDCIAVII